MTEKDFLVSEQPICPKTSKTTVNGIMGLVKTEEKTDSVELKKEYYKNQSKDKHYTYLDYSKDGYIGSFYENGKPLTNKAVGDLLNEQEKEIQRLNHLIKIATELIDWNTIPQVRRQWKKYLKNGDV